MRWAWKLHWSLHWVVLRWGNFLINFWAPLSPVFKGIILATWRGRLEIWMGQTMELELSWCSLNHACVRARSVSCVWLSVTPWTVAHQAPLSMGCSRQEYWSGLPFPPGDLPHPGVEPTSLTSALAGGFLYHCTTWERAETRIQFWRARLTVGCVWAPLDLSY